MFFFDGSISVSHTSNVTNSQDALSTSVHRPDDRFSTLTPGKQSKSTKKVWLL